MVRSNEAMMPSHTTTRISSSRATLAQCWSAQPLESSCRPTEESLGAFGAEESRDFYVLQKHCKKKMVGEAEGLVPHFSDLFWIFYCDLLFVSIVWPFQLTRYLKPFSEHDILESVELFNGLHRGPPTFLETIETENLMDCWGLLLRMFAIQTENMIVWDFTTNSALLCHDL